MHKTRMDQSRSRLQPLERGCSSEPSAATARRFPHCTRSVVDKSFRRFKVTFHLFCKPSIAKLIQTHIARMIIGVTLCAKDSPLLRKHPQTTFVVHLTTIYTSSAFRFPILPRDTTLHPRIASLVRYFGARFFVPKSERAATQFP